MPGYINENGKYVATMGWVVAPFSGSWWKRYVKAPVSGVMDLIKPDFTKRNLRRAA